MLVAATRCGENARNGLMGFVSGRHCPGGGKPLTNRLEGPTQPDRGVDGQRVAVEGAAREQHLPRSCAAARPPSRDRERTRRFPSAKLRGLTW